MTGERAASGPLPAVGSAGSASVVVGIPSRNEVSTIAAVAAAAEEGLRLAGLVDEAVLVNVDNGSTDGTPERFLSATGDARRMTISTGAGGTGKGTNVMAILRRAAEIHADAVILLDADVRSVEPRWVVEMLATLPSAEDQPAMVLPVYQRNPYEGNTTNHLAGPLMASVFGSIVQQPIAGDFAFNRAFLAEASTWPVPESAHLYGIDIHLSANAARCGHQLLEVQLGRKFHNPGFPKILGMSQQVVDSLFHVVSRVDSPRPQRPVSPVRRSVDVEAVRPPDDLVARTVRRVADHLTNQQATIRHLFPSIASAPELPIGLVVVDGNRWARLLADALSALAAGHGEQARDHLVALYLCRVMTWWEEIERLGDPEAIDAALAEQTGTVVAAIAERNLDLTDTPPMPLTFRPGPWGRV